MSITIPQEVKMLTTQGMTRLDGTGEIYTQDRPLCEVVKHQLNDIYTLFVTDNGELNVERTNSIREQVGKRTLPHELFIDGIKHYLYCYKDESDLTQFEYCSS